MIYLENIEKIKNKEKAQLIKSICEEIIKTSDVVNKISIFGSVARGNDEPDSDIDFYLEFNESPIDEDYLYTENANKIIDVLRNYTFGKGECDIIIKDDFCIYNNRFINNIRKDEIICYER